VPDGDSARARRQAQREAEAWLAEQLRLKRLGMAVDPRARKLRDVLDEWAAAKVTDGEWGPTNTLRTRQHIEQRLKPTLGDVYLHKLTPEHVRRMMAALADPGTRMADSPNRRVVRENRALSPTTRGHILGCLSAALSWAVEQGYVEQNVAKRIRRPRRQPASLEDQLWSGDELGRFLGHVADEPDHPLWRLLAMTGMRRGEALGLQWADIDGDPGTVRIRRRRLQVGTRMVVEAGTKTSEGRTIDLDPATVATLRAYRRAQV
jgi:integrase